MIDVQPYIHRLHLLKLYLENKIYCIGKQPFPYEFDWWAKEVMKDGPRTLVYWVDPNKK